MTAYVFRCPYCGRDWHGRETRRPGSRRKHCGECVVVKRRQTNERTPHNGKD